MEEVKTKHTIKIDEDLILTVAIPNEMNIQEASVVVSNIQRILNMTLKQQEIANNKFGYNSIAQPTKPHVYLDLSIEEKQKMVEVWDNAKFGESIQAVRANFPILNDCSDKAIQARIAKIKAELNAPKKCTVITKWPEEKELVEKYERNNITQNQEWANELNLDIGQLRQKYYNTRNKLNKEKVKQ